MRIKYLGRYYGLREKNTRELRKLHNADKQNYIFSPNIITKLKSRRLRGAGHVVRVEESTNAYRALVERPEGKRPLWRSTYKWENNIKMDLREVGCDPAEWIDLAEDRDQWRAYVRAVMNLRVP